jgi:hypothetical protein
MITKFKFFKGFIGTLDLMDGQTYATASLYNPNTIRYEDRSERISRRIQLDEELRNHDIISQEQYNLNRDMFAQHEIVRRRIETDNQIRLYQATRVTTVNPKWWMKIKIVLQESWLYDPIGVVVMTLLTSLVTFIGIAKLFGS